MAPSCGSLRRVRQDLGRQREPLPQDAPDAAIVVENDEILAAIENAAYSELDRIEHALARLDAGVFGLCETCGAEIDEARLRAVPYTAGAWLRPGRHEHGKPHFDPRGRSKSSSQRQSRYSTRP